MQSDDMRITPDMVAVTSAQSEPGRYYFPDDFVLQPNESEPEVYEYY